MSYMSLVGDEFWEIFLIRFLAEHFRTIAFIQIKTCSNKSYTDMHNVINIVSI